MGLSRRSVDRFYHKRAKRAERLFAVYHMIRLPFDLWLGRGAPLSPYVVGVLIDILRDHSRPKDLVVPDDKFYESDDHKTLLEYTVLRRWMQQWLSWQLWYCKVALIRRLRIIFCTTTLSLSLVLSSLSRDWSYMASGIVYKELLHL